jgi:hypothetical protein
MAQSTRLLQSEQVRGFVRRSIAAAPHLIDALKQERPRLWN